MNIPIIPDRLFKLFLYIGLGLIIYGFLSHQNQYQEYEKKRIEFNVEIKKLENQSKYLELDLKDIYDKSDRISNKSEIKNPLSITDSSYSFSRIIVGDNIEKAVCDSIDNLLNQFDIKNKEIKIKDDELSVKRYELDELKNWLSEIEEASFHMIIIGVFLFFFGILMWDKNEEIDTKIKIRQNLDKPTYSDNCQSCGKHFNSMVKYGSEIDGNRNYHFCLECYQNGDFSNPMITLKEIKDQRQRELESKKYSKIWTKLILEKISRLDRWK